jgi:predicted ATPase/DNA-binding SARP family transcriptional activator
MSRLRLSLLGPFQISLDDQPVTAITSSKIQALLAYLAVEADRPHRRETLAELLWPDRPAGNALQNLRQALSRARRALRPAAGTAPFLLVTRDTAQRNPESDVWLDVAVFTDALAFCASHHHKQLYRCRRCRRQLEDAVSAYRGDFLQGVMADSYPFEEWALLKREWLRREALQALYHLAEGCAWRGDYAQAYRHAWRQVEIDPLRESAHRQVMRALALSGRRGEALAQYDTVRRVLEEELGVEPAEETTALFERVRDGIEEPPLPGSVQATAPHAHNLPTQHSPFIGREEELTRIAERIDNPDCHLLTLVGPGGVGKSRLAIQTALEKADEFEGGAYFVGLAPAGDEFLLTAIADALQFTFSSGVQSEAERTTQLLDFLRGKELLLLLDNFEHLLSLTNLLVTLLDRAPRVQLLVTSREPLNLRAEWVLDITGLPFPKTEEQVSKALAYPAVQLFYECARRVQADFALSPKTTPPVIRICQLVAGVPLAIELATPWVRSVPVDEIAQEIAANLDFLATSMQDVPERQRSTRASFGHSWNLLTDEERRVVQGLSIFRGGFTEEAAIQVTACGPEVLTSLGDKSLLRRVSSDSVEANPRYETHELVRQYAAEKLAARPGEQHVTKGRHSAYYAAFLEQKEEGLQGDTLKDTLEEINIEIDNARLSWDWAIQERQIAAIERSLEALFQYYWLRGLYQQGERAFGHAAAMLSADLGDGAVDDERQDLLGRVWARQGTFSEILATDDQKTQDLLHKGLSLFRKTGNKKEMAFVFNTLGRMQRRSGAFDQAERNQQQSLSLYEAAGAVRQMVAPLNELAMVAYLRDDYEAGVRYARESLELCRELGDERGVARTLNLIGLLAIDDAQYELAERHLANSLQAFERLGETTSYATVMNNLGLLAFKQAKYNEAQEWYQACVPTFDDVGDPYGVALAHYNLGRVAYQQGDYERAEKHHLESLAVRQEMGRQYLIGISLLYLGHVYLAQKEQGQAKRHFLEALEAAKAVEHAPLTLLALTFIARLWAAEGETGRALELLSFVIHHPESDTTFGDFAIRAEAKMVYGEIVGEQLPEVVELAEQRGRAKTLEAVLDDVLR